MKQSENDAAPFQLSKRIKLADVSILDSEKDGMGIVGHLHVRKISVDEEGTVVDGEEDLAGRGEDFAGNVTVHDPVAYEDLRRFSIGV